MAFMTVKNAKEYKSAHSGHFLKRGGTPYESSIDLTHLLTGGETKVIYKPDDIETVHTHNSQNDNRAIYHQDDVFHRILTQELEFEEEDNAGLDIEFNSDFVMSAVHVNLRNKQTG
jgi:hypothetical protein